jgi:hypothetical protein
MAEAFGLAKQIGLQDQQTVEDLPHRWMLLTLVAALSAWFLPPWHVAGLYIGTLIMEVLSCRVARRLATNSDRVTALIYLALTFISSSLFALLMGMIWSQEGVAPKVVAFAVRMTAQ